jgi:hypothetical protein
MDFLNFKRPDYTYISGSFALNYKLKKLDEIEKNDIDLYVNICDSKFKVVGFVKFIKFLIDDNYTLLSLSNKNYSSNYIKKECEDEILEKIHIMKNKKKCNMYDYIKDGKFSVIKLVRNKNTYQSESQIDIILIKSAIDNFINKHFDISIVKNYIKSNNLVVCMHLEDINNKIAYYDLDKFISKIKNYIHFCKFIERMCKYTSRGFCIRMKSVEVEIDLTEESVKMLLSGICRFIIDMRIKEHRPRKHVLFLSTNKEKFKMSNNKNCVEYFKLFSVFSFLDKEDYEKNNMCQSIPVILYKIRMLSDIKNRLY